MTWKPISRERLHDEIDAGIGRMTEPQRRLWQTIRIKPEKWQQEPWGNEGGGFWVVAISGDTAIWYDDIEEGFEHSSFSQYGVLDESRVGQYELEWVVQDLLEQGVTPEEKT